MVRDPIWVVHQIYTALGERLTPEAESRMTKFVGENPQAKWGRHVYSAMKFGLKPPAIEEQFRFYTERFGMSSSSEIAAAK